MQQRELSIKAKTPSNTEIPVKISLVEINETILNETILNNHLSIEIRLRSWQPAVAEVRLACWITRVYLIKNVYKSFFADCFSSWYCYFLSQYPDRFYILSPDKSNEIEQSYD